MDKDNGKTKISYEPNENPPNWWRDAIDAMPWEPTEVDGVVVWYQKAGPCPRCDDANGITVSLEAEAWLGIGPEEDTDIFVACQCAGDHTRPDGVSTGCGWGGYVAGPVGGSGR